MPTIARPPLAPLTGTICLVDRQPYANGQLQLVDPNTGVFVPVEPQQPEQRDFLRALFIDGPSLSHDLTQIAF